MEKKRILYVLQGLGNGGVASVITNYHRTVANQIEADYIVLSTVEKVDKNPSVKTFLEKQGSKVYEVYPFTKNMLKYMRDVYKIIAKNNYDCVHDNNKYFAFLSLLPAKICRVKKRICHCHVTVAEHEKGIAHRIFIKVSAWLSCCLATSLLACSEQAGKSIFGKHAFKVLNNAVDINKYQYSETVRSIIRKQLGVHDEYLLMMVARWDPIKRHDFALKVFDELKLRKPNVKFVIVGCTLDDFSKNTKAVYDSLPIATQQSIIFLGRRTDVADLLQAADGFVLTSEHEGLGISIVEAQVAGIPCFVSDSVPREVRQTDLVTFLPVVSKPQLWANTIINFTEVLNRSEYAKIIKNSPFSIEQSAADLLQIYDIDR